MRRVGHACRHCRSPSRGHPCWYYLLPGYDPDDEPPCLRDQRNEEYEAGRRMAWIIGSAVAIAAIGAWLMAVVLV